jgi:nucleoside-diphosphate-sugar epimerase
MRIIVLRPPLVYGPGVGANFAALARLATTGLPLPLGAVRNRRSLVYVGNLVAAVLRCLARSDVASGTFHVCDDAAVATPELVRAIAQAYGARARLFPVPPSLLEGAARLLGREAQAARLLGSLEVDGSRFRSAFDWQPPFTLAQGLAAMGSSDSSRRAAADDPEPAC